MKSPYGKMNVYLFEGHNVITEAEFYMGRKQIGKWDKTSFLKTLIWHCLSLGIDRTASGVWHNWSGFIWLLSSNLITLLNIVRIDTYQGRIREFSEKFTDKSKR